MSMPTLADLAAVAALAAACAGWVLVQRWVARRDPDNPGIVRDCGGCAQGGACEDHCRARR